MPADMPVPIAFVGWVLVVLRFCDEPSVTWKLVALREAEES